MSNIQPSLSAQPCPADVLGYDSRTDPADEDTTAGLSRDLIKVKLKLTLGL